MTATSSKHPRTDARPDFLLGETLPEYTLRLFNETCSAWSAARNISGEIDEARCQYAAAQENRVRSAIKEIAEKSRAIESELTTLRSAGEAIPNGPKKRYGLWWFEDCGSLDPLTAWTSYAIKLRAYAVAETTRANAAEAELRLRELQAPPIDRDEKIRAMEDAIRQHFEARRQAEAERDRAAKDAERYRWLADKVIAPDYGDNPWRSEGKGKGYWIDRCKGPEWIEGETLDAAIDRARHAAAIAIAVKP